MGYVTKRIQRRRTAGWRMPEGALYVGRPGRWGNPIRPVHCDRRRHDDGMQEFSSPHWHLLIDDLDISAMRWATKAEAAEWAVKAFRLRVMNPDLYDQDEIREELAGHDLACWCPLGSPCHADTLLAIANEQAGDQG